MLADAEIIGHVVRAIRRFDLGPVVVDPVAVSTHGDQLLQPAAVDALRQALLPLSTRVTPNLSEVELLTGITVRERDDLVVAARPVRVARLNSNALELDGVPSVP